MDTAIVRQFLDYFQDFLNLCQLENWPNNDTSEAEIEKAFNIAVHIEKSLDKLQRRNILDDFLSALNTDHTSKQFLKNCFGDPTKYILKKILTSKCKITQTDTGITVFLKLFSEEKLEEHLAQIMLETASKETLIRHLFTEIPRSKLIEFKSQLILSELSQTNSIDPVLNILKNCTQDTIELLIVGLFNKDYKHHNAILNILNSFKQIMSSRDSVNKKFWRHLLRLDTNTLARLGLEYSELFKLITTALIDCSKLIKEDMSAEYFYIELSFSELALVVQKICSNDNLKLEFFDIVREKDCDVEFWETMVS